MTSPSRLKYAEENPRVSFRVTREMKAWIDDVRGDASYTGMLRNALIKGAEAQESINNAFKQGFSAGYQVARNEFRLMFWCSACKKIMSCPPNSEMYRYLVRQALDAGWHHSNCSKR